MTLRSRDSSLSSRHMLEETAARPAPASRAAARPTESVHVVIAILTVFAAALRIYRLGDRSLWVDEITTAQTAALPALGQVLMATPINRMPLDLVLSWLLHFLGGGEIAVRIPSAVYGTLLVPIVFLLGRRLLGVRGGLIAAFVVAISPFAIWYSQEASPYSLLMLLTTVQMWSAHRAVHRARLADWLFLAFATALNLYTHYTAAFVTVAAFAYIAVELALQAREPKMRWEPVITRFLGAGTAGMLAILALAPWAPAIRGFLTLQAGADAAKYAGAGGEGLGRVSALITGLGFEWAVGALAVVGLWLALNRRAMLLGLWLGVPLLALAVLLGPGLANVLPRYLAAEWPAAALLAAAGVEVCVDRVGSSQRISARGVALGLVALLALVTGAHAVRWYGEPKDDWRGAAATVRAGSGGGGIVLAMGLGSDFAATSIEYYLRRQGSEVKVLDAGGSTDIRAVDDRMAETMRFASGPAWAVFAGIRGPADLRADGRSETGDYTTPSSLPRGFSESDLTGVTLVKAPSVAALLEWAGTFLPAVRATAALVENRPWGATLLPPPAGTGPVHLEATGPPVDRTWSTGASGETPLVARFRCASNGGGDARVYVSAHDRKGAWLGLYPGNAGYACGGAEGAFAFALPTGTVLVKLWLRVSGRGSGDFSDLSLTVADAA